MEDFLRDSLGIVEENVMQMVNEKEVCNVSFTSVLASIEEELNNEETVEDEADMIMSRTEPPPSLQKLEAEVYISPKINIYSRTPKMALHENPGTPCPWIVIFLHGLKKRQFFCTW